jgi:hypothetical protein
VRQITGGWPPRRQDASMFSLLRRLPPRLGMVLMVALAIFTTHKMYSMARMRGFIGKRIITVHHITDKKRETSFRNAHEREFCFVSWAESASENDPQHRVQVDCDRWRKLELGDRIEVARIDEDDSGHMIGAEVFESDGNFVFDMVLLGIELAGLLWYWTKHKESQSAAGG